MNSTPSVITICTLCRPADTPRETAPGKALFAAVQGAAVGMAEILVRPTQCLSVCTRVCAVSLSGEGKYTFVFGGLDAACDADALIEMAKACAADPLGFVPWKNRPEALRKGMIARVPPPGWCPDDGSAPA